jgi:hypothetical protein
VLSESDPALRDEIIAALRARGDKHSLLFVLTVEGEQPWRESGLDFSTL